MEADAQHVSIQKQYSVVHTIRAFIHMQVKQPSMYMFKCIAMLVY